MRIFITKGDGQCSEALDEIQSDFESLFNVEEVNFSKADILPGASCLALLVEFKELISIGALMAIFFSGKRIEENLEAWMNILRRLISLYERVKSNFRKYKLNIDNQSAALISLHHIFDRYDSKGYRLVRVFGVNGFVQDVIDYTDQRMEECHVGMFVSFICIFEMDDMCLCEVVVDSSGEVLRSGLLSREGIDDHDSEYLSGEDVR